MFDEVVVSIGVNPDKHSTYTVDERKAMLAAITQEFPNVVVDTFENEFLVNYAHKICADFTRFFACFYAIRSKRILFYSVKYLI